MVRELRDQVGKGITVLALDGRGKAEIEKELVAQVQAVDVWFTPRPDAGPSTNLFASLAQGPTLFELFSGRLREADLHACLSKRLAVRAELLRQHRTAPRRGAPPEPLLVLVATTVSETLLSGIGATQETPGLYRTPRMLATVIVAVHRLTRTLATLPARLMGRGRVLRAAVAELTALPYDTPLVRSLRDLLVRWRVELQRAEMLTPDEEEFVMETESAFDTWYKEVVERERAEGRKAGREAGRKAGRKEGRKEGEVAGQVGAALRMLAARFGEVPHAVEAKARAITDPDEASRLVDVAIQAPSLAAVADALPAPPSDH
ncbi:MAG: hypothetical protein AMXMBFR64_62610 [Myxococcales bacterium]